jgi:hypothetical protein
MRFCRRFPPIALAAPPQKKTESRSRHPFPSCGAIYSK